MQQKAQKGEYIDILLRSKQTVFSTKDIALLWRSSNTNATRVRLNYYVKARKLIRIRRGVYAKDKNYNRYEFSTKILRPAYVSFETILGSSGMMFQYYDQIFVASYVKREIICDHQKYAFVKMKKTILNSPIGIDQDGEFAKASKERACLDTIYRSKKYYFDNLDSLDWDRVFEILPIYHNKKMEKTVHQYYEMYKTKV